MFSFCGSGKLMVPLLRKNTFLDFNDYGFVQSRCLDLGSLEIPILHANPTESRTQEDVGR